MFPKRKAGSIPSIRAGGWDACFVSGRKLSISRSIFVRLRPRLAGLAAIFVLQGLELFLDFILQTYITTCFEKSVTT